MKRSTKTVVKSGASVIKPAVGVAAGNVLAQKITDLAIQTVLGAQSATVRQIGSMLLPLILAAIALGVSRKEFARHLAIGCGLASVQQALDLVWPAQSMLQAPVTAAPAAVPSMMLLPPARARTYPEVFTSDQEIHHSHFS